MVRDVGVIFIGGSYSIRNTFMTSSPRWLITLTAMRPVFGTGNGRETALLSVAHTSASISALSVVLSARTDRGQPVMARLQ